ncbi:5-methylcytosine restriction system specificity protein McrC [Brevundimonas naejangsanensis]|uniref:5-methylcytosine restriction system specificity protein McrC n=1 Tax=Brevundimonas naejangsanensis TaxID=588932 RepID=UPI003209A583
MTLVAQADADPILDGEGRRVFRGVEWQETAIPADLLVDGDRIDVYEAVGNSSAFTIRTRGSRLYLQAGNAIGYIPVNDRVALEINARVPLANLERLLMATDDYLPSAIGYERNYGEVDDIPRPFLDFLTDSLLTAVDGLRVEGLHKTYDHILHQGAPSGRILPFESALAQRRANRPTAVSKRFERTVDTEANRRIKAALARLQSLYSGMRDRTGRRKRLTGLSAALSFFGEVPMTAAPAPLSRFDDLRHLPDQRPWLGRAVALSTMVLRNAGLEVRAFKGPIIAESLLIQMDDVFEQYVRQVLRRRLQDRPGVAVLDGNKAKPEGAAGRVFDEVFSALGNSPSTPDTVIEKDGATVVVVETKYKLCPGLPERDYINQVVTYAATHRCRNVVLAYPSHNDRCTLERLGRIGEVILHKAVIPLGRTDMLAVEVELGTLFATFLD